MAKDKSRYFTFLMYPESIPEDWETKLTELDQPIAVSPLHNMDDKEFDSKNIPSVEEQALLDSGHHIYKKAHYHCIYIANNPVTADAVRNKLKRALGDKAINKIQIINGLKSTYDYLTHDSADAVKKKKHKYDKKDIKLLNNFDIDRYVTIDDSEKRNLYSQILKYVLKYRIENIIELMEFVQAYGDKLGLPRIEVINDTMASRTSLLKLYFDGNYQRNKRGKKQLPKLDESDVEKANAVSSGQDMPKITTEKTFDWDTGEVLNNK